MFFFVTIETEMGQYYCCVRSDTPEQAELIALNEYSVDDEVYCATAVEFNQSEHGDPRDYKLFA